MTLLVLPENSSTAAIKRSVRAENRLSADKDDNHLAYVTQLEQTVSDRSRMVGAYRTERPGFELAFLIFDDSAAYFGKLGVFGQDRMGRQHIWFADAAFAETMTASGANCFV